MTKEAGEVKPNYGPVYAAALYPDLAPIFIAHGYALAVHGSLARDFDLIAVPWVDAPSSPDVVLEAVQKKFTVHIIGEPTAKPQGRVAHTLSIGYGECAVDLSFMPTQVLVEKEDEQAKTK